MEPPSFLPLPTLVSPKAELPTTDGREQLELRGGSHDLLIPP